MTPKLKLRDEARKALLSWILKFLFPGIWRIMISIQMMLDPAMHASEALEPVLPAWCEARRSRLLPRASAGHIPIPLVIVITQPLVSLLIAESMTPVSHRAFYERLPREATSVVGVCWSR